MASGERIEVRIGGSARGLQVAAAEAVAAIGGVRAATKGADRDTRQSAGGFSLLGGAIGAVNKRATLLRNTWAALKFPALLTGAGLAAQGLSAAAAAAAALAGALGPLSGLLVTLPAGLAAAGQAAGAGGLATHGIGDTIKAALAADDAAATAAASGLGKQADMADQVAASEEGLAQSQRQARLAQTDLTRARQEARRELEDMRASVRRARDEEARGRLSIEEAEAELRRVRADPGSTDRDVQDARLRVSEAHSQLEDTRRENRREKADLEQARKRGGVRGMPQVVQARRALADANRAVSASETALANAERDATAGAGAGAAATSKLAMEMAKLPPAGQHVVRYLLSLRPRLKELRAIAAEGVLPGAQAGLQSAMANFGVVRRAIGLTADQMGRLSREAGRLVGSKAFGRDLGVIGARNARLLGNMGDSGLSLASALRHVMVAGGPLVDWLGNTTEKLSAAVDEWAAAGRESGRLGTFFDHTRQALELAAPLAWDFARALVNIGAAGRPLGMDVLGSLRDSARAFREWTASVRGRNELAAYFEHARPVIFETGRLIHDLTASFFRLGTQPGVVQLIRQFRTDLLPVLEDVIGTTTKAFGPHLIAMLVSLTKVLGDFAGATGPLTVLADAVRMFADALHFLMTNVPGMHLAMVDLVSGLALLKIGQLAAKVLWLDKLAAAIKGVAVAEAVAGGAGVAAGGGAVAKGAAGAAAVARGAAKGGATRTGMFGVQEAAAAAGGAGAASKIGKFAGLAGRLKPLAFKAGLVGVGLSLISGAAAAFGDKSRQASLAGKIGNFFRGAIGAKTKDYGAEARKIRDAILKGTQSSRYKTVAPLRPGQRPGSIDTFNQFDDPTKKWLEKAESARKAVAKLFGKGVVLKPRFDETAFYRIKQNLKDLAHGRYSFDELARSAKANFDLIGKSGIDITKGGGLALVERNFKATMHAIGASVKAGTMTVGEGMRAMSQAMRTHSAAGKDAIGHNFTAAARLIRKTMSDAGRLTAAGMKTIHQLMRDTLSSFGIHGGAASMVIQRYGSEGVRNIAEGKTVEGRTTGDPHGGPKVARGGLFQFGRQGAKGRDNIPARVGRQQVVVGSGEQAAVYNRHQQQDMNARLAATGVKGGLAGYFRKPWAKHYMAAGGLLGRVRPPVADTGDRRDGRSTSGAPEGVASRRQRGRVGSLVRAMAAGGLVPIPGEGGIQIDRRILADVVALKRKYRLDITAGYAPTGHAAGGEHPLGLAIDAGPAGGGGWGLVDRLAHWAEPSQNAPRAPFRWVGYTGDPNHGPGNHIHLSWLHGPGFPAAWVQTLRGKIGRGGAVGPVPKLPQFKVNGGGAVGAAVQAALGIARAGAQKKLKAAARAAGAVPGGGGGGARGGPAGWQGAVGDGSGLMKKIAAGRGWSFADWWALDASETSHGRNLVNPTSTARLRGQFLDMNYGRYGPGSDPAQHPSMVQQIWSMAKYIKARYGDPSAAWAFHQAHNYYAKGGLVGYVGDSLGVGTAPFLKGRLHGKLRADVATGRTSASGVEALKGMLGKSFGEYVVDLGTNDQTAGQLSSSVRRADKLTGRRPLVVPTVNGPFATPAKNKALHRLAGGDIHLVEWAAHDRGLLGPDGIHPTGRGYQRRAGLLATALAKVAKGPAGDAGKPGKPGAPGTPSAAEVAAQEKKVKGLADKAKKDKRLRDDLKRARARLRSLRGRRRKGVRREARFQRRVSRQAAALGLEPGYIAAVEKQERDIEDAQGAFSTASLLAERDETVTPVELKDLVKRAGLVRGLIGGTSFGQAGEAKLLLKYVLPRIAEKIRKAREMIRQLERRVRENSAKIKAKRARLHKVEGALDKLDKVKKPTHAQRATKARLGRERATLKRQLPPLEQDNVFISGQRLPRNVRSLEPETMLGGVRAVLNGDSFGGGDGLLSLQHDYGDKLRPGGLPAEWASADTDVFNLVRSGATKSDADDSRLRELVDLMRQQNVALMRSLAVGQAQFGALRSVAPQVLGRYAHGTGDKAVPQTGLYMLEQGEKITPAPQGPYPDVNRAAGGKDRPVQVDVHFHGDAGPLLDKVDVMVDGKLIRHKQAIERRSRTFARAPGRA